MWADNILPEITRESIQNYIRLVVLVACYILARGYYTNWSKTRQVARQLALEKKAKEQQEAEKKQGTSLDEGTVDPEAVLSFGWGKKTASIQKKRQQAVNKLAHQVRERQQTAFDAAEDHDIEDLLEE